MNYNVLEDRVDEETDNNAVTTITQTAALMAASSSTDPTSGTEVSVKVAVAINQLVSNQSALMAQMAALSFAPPPAQHTRMFVPCELFSVLLIQQVADFLAAALAVRGGDSPPITLAALAHC